MKKKLMNTTENIPIPMFERNEAAEPIIDENTDTSNIFCTSCITAVSILKSGPSFGKAARSDSFMCASGTEMCLAASSTFVMEMPFTMLLTIGITSVSTDAKIISTSAMAETASNQSGARWPRILIFFSWFTMGLATSDTTTAISMYISTLLKYQHSAAMMPVAAASMMYLASLSMLLSSVMSILCICFKLLFLLHYPVAQLFRGIGNHPWAICLQFLFCTETP